MKQATKICTVVLAGLMAVSLISWNNLAKNTEDGNMSVKQIKALAEEMMSSEMATDVNSPGFVGLSNASEVGVETERFTSEEKFPVNEIDYEQVIDASQTGLIANDLEDDTLAFADILSRIRESGKKTLLRLPEGELDFIQGMNPVNRNAAISIVGIDNLTIFGNNTTIMIHGAMTGFDVSDCTNVTIKGIAFDYGRTPFSMGRVVESGENYVVIRFKDNYPITDDTQFNDYLEFDKYTKMPRVNGNFLLASQIGKVERNGQTVKVTYETKLKSIPNDTIVGFTHYTYSQDAFYFSECKGTKLENVDVYTCAGMGLVMVNCENTDLNRFNVRLKPNTDRLVTATADCCHFSACRGTLTVTNCLFENSHDDAINVKAGHYLGVDAIDRDANRIVLKVISGITPYKVGDVLNFYTKESLSYICSVEVAELAEEAAGYTVTTKEAIPESLTTDLLCANVTSAPKVTIENNVIRNKRNRGILFQSVDSVIRNNTFINVGHGALGIMTEASAFNEAIVPSNVLVENNKFIGCSAMTGAGGTTISVIAYGQNWVSAEAGAIKNVTIRNNFIAESYEKAIMLVSCSDSLVENNLIYNPAVFNSDGGNTAIVLGNSASITIRGNCCLKENAGEDYRSLTTDGTVLESSVTMEGNYGLSFGSVVASIEEDPIYRLASGTVVDMTTEDLSGFENVPGSIKIRGITDAYGNETFLKTGDFEIKTFKVAYDDTGIYIGFEIVDDEIYVAGQSSYWNGDGFELFMTAETESGYAFPIVRNDHETSTAQIYVTPDFSVFESSRTSKYLMDRQEDFKIKSWLTQTGWAGKIFIPFSACTELRDLATTGGVASFSFIFADMDEGQDRVQASNTTHNVEQKKGVPAKMGKIRFAGEE